MIFHAIPASPAIKLTIFPTSAPALGSSAFAASFFSSCFSALPEFDLVEHRDFWTDLTFGMVIRRLFLLDNPGKVFSFQGFVINRCHQL